MKESLHSVSKIKFHAACFNFKNSGMNHTRICSSSVSTSRLKYFKIITLTIIKINISTNQVDRQDPRAPSHEQPSM